eukprot:140968-Amphidinium_carterae.2
MAQLEARAWRNTAMEALLSHGCKQRVLPPETFKSLASGIQAKLMLCETRLALMPNMSQEEACPTNDVGSIPTDTSRRNTT